jgi:DNA-binding NarL/FixJ family response regulator
MPIRVMIVDDHPLFRDGLRVLLQQQGDFTLVGEADTVASAVRLAQDVRPDVVLMDLGLPDGGGVEATRQIVAQQPQIHVIALTVHDEPAMLAAMAEAGAHGYILKGIRSAELIRAVRMVVVTGVALSPEVLPDLLQQYRQLAQTAETESRLSAREQEILRLIAAGATNRDIAARLALSTQTIKNILSVLFEKLAVSNRTEAVVAALDKGLLEKATDLAPGST